MQQYRIIIIEDEDQESIEQLGTKRKFWFKNDDSSSLFKVGRENTGENWVEVVSSELCELLDIPHAHYDFSKYKSFDGTATKNFVPDGARLVHGNELLAKAYQSVDIEYDANSFYKVRNYDLRLIKVILSNKKIHPALDSDLYEKYETAFDMFIGYIVFDCLISNQDRHHENWGLIALGEYIYLAPSFDHASGLGSKESDEKKKMRLSGKDKRATVESFVQRAKTPFYSKGEILSTFDAVKQCMTMNKDMTIHWINKIENLDFAKIEQIFQRVQKEFITQISIDFAIQMIKENQKRLLDLKKGA